MAQSRLKLASSPGSLFFWRMRRLCAPTLFPPFPLKRGPGNKTKTNNTSKHRWWLVRNFLISDRCSSTSGGTTPRIHVRMHCTRRVQLLSQHFWARVRTALLADSARTNMKFARHSDKYRPDSAILYSWAIIDFSEFHCTNYSCELIYRWATPTKINSARAWCGDYSRAGYISFSSSLMVDDRCGNNSRAVTTIQVNTVDVWPIAAMHLRTWKCTCSTADVGS